MADPVVKIFMSHYLDGNQNEVSTETLIQTIPFDSEPVMLQPKVKVEMGKAGSFEFSMESASPIYNSLMQMKTIFRVTYFGETVFRGRVLTIGRTMWGTRSIHCEGDFTFLMDSHQIGTKEETRPTIGVLAYLQQIIAQHNSDMGNDNWKKFTLGEVPGQYTSKTPTEQRVTIPDEKAQQKFGETSWNTSMDRLEDLLGDFGGYFRTRYDENTKVTYLDWYDRYYSSIINPQTIEVTKNLIDLGGSTEVDNLFTVIIPIGRSNSENVYITDYWPVISSGHAKVPYILVSELATIPLYTDAELNSGYHRKEDYAGSVSRFGMIWKTADFENANTPEKLFAYAKDWIKNNYMPEVTQWDVSAMDLRFVNGTDQFLRCGDRVTLTHPEVAHTFDSLSVISVEYDLYNPEGNKYSIGIPNQQINAAYGVKETTTKSGKTSKSKGGGSKSGGGKEKKQTEEERQAELKNDLLQNYINKSQFGADISYDDPLAFLTYGTDLSVLSEQEAKERLREYNAAIDQFKKLYKHNPEFAAEVDAEAAAQGVDPFDTQFMIDYLPSLRQQQTKWKNDADNYAVSTLGMTRQQTAVLFNDSSSQSWFAGLVDDDGNWTPLAYRGGIPQAPGAAKIKIAARNARKILNRNASTPTADLVNAQTDNVVSNNLEISNVLNAGIDGFKEVLGQWLPESAVNMLDGDFSILNSFISPPDGSTPLHQKVLDIFNGFINGSSEEAVSSSGGENWWKKVGSMLGIFTGNNTEDGGKEGKMETDTVDIDGSNDQNTGGSMAVGSGGGLDGWTITLNRPITYKDDKGVSHTVDPGCVGASDFHITNTYDSLYSKLVVVDVLLADYAKINTLEALKASIDNITGQTIIADTRLLASLGRFTTLYADEVHLQNSDGGSKANLGACFSSGLFDTTTTAGIVHLILSRAHGVKGTDLDISFSIADAYTSTQFVSGSQAGTIKLQRKTYGNSSWTDAGSFSIASAYTDTQFSFSKGIVKLKKKTYGSPDTWIDVNSTFSFADAYTGLKFVEGSGTSAGKITLQGKTYGNSSWTDISSFNIASTAKYIADVEAAWNNGGKTAYAVLTAGTTTLNPGGSATVSARFVDADGAAGMVPTPSSGHDVSKTITARALNMQTKTVNAESTVQTYTPDSGYDGFSSFTVNAAVSPEVPTASNIDLSGPYFTTSGSRYADATLNTMGSVINQNVGRQGYVYFEASLTNGSGTKIYRIPIN